MAIVNQPADAVPPDYLEARAHELIDGLERTGGGNWPPLVKIFARIGRLMKEDGFVAGSKQAQTTPQKSIADRLFG